MARFGLGGGPRVVDSTVFALLRAIAALVGTTFVLIALAYSGYLSYTDLDAPAVALPSDPVTVDHAGRELQFGRSNLTRDGRLWRMHFEGSNLEIGAAHGSLAGRQIQELDARVTARVEQRYGSAVEQWTAAMLLRWNYRGADRHLEPAIREELAALSASVPELRSKRASAYQRVFMYQCFQGLAQRLDDIVLEGTVFAVAPRRSHAESGNLIIGRTLSFDLGHDFEADRMLYFYRPDGRYPFVSVGWPGLLGVVTGINARGIFVALNAARTDDPLEDGSPLPLVLRRVLEEADTLEHAVQIIHDADLRSSGIVLIGDGVARKAAILEVAARDREDRRVLRGEGEPILWATDHMLKEVFEADLQNDWVRRYSSSGYRYERLDALLHERGPIDPRRAAAILRDRRGADGETLGLGNRNALENLATTHSVVVDATAMVMWVAEGPSNLGRYRAFDLATMLGRENTTPAPLEDIPADPLLYSEEYQDYREARESIDHARSLLTRGSPQRALWSAQVALALAPDIGDLHRLLGDIKRELGEHEEALVHYRRYLELVPGRRRDQVRVEGIIAELEG